jgi:hypothetical protein
MRKLVSICALLLGTLLPMLCTLGYAAAEEKKASRHVDLLPHDVSGFVTIRVKDLWDEDIVKDVLKKLAADPRGDLSAMFEKNMGIELKQIDRVTLILPSTAGSGDSAVTIFTALKPLDQTKVKDAIVPKATEKKTANGKVYFESLKLVVHFIGDDTFVVGDEKPTLAYLEKKPDPTKQTRFKEVRQLVEKNTAVAMVELSDFGADLEKQLPPLEGIGTLSKARPAALTVTMNKESAVDLKLTFATEDSAKEGEKAAKSVRDQLSAKLASQVKEAQKEAANPNTKNDAFKKFLLDQVIELLTTLQSSVEKAECSRSGREVQVTVKAKVSAGKAVLAGVLGAYFMVRKVEKEPAPPQG